MCMYLSGCTTVRPAEAHSSMPPLYIQYTSGDYEITETSHYDVSRAGSIGFEKIPVDASSKMPDDYMDSIEPYDYADLKPFSTAYLPGFMADKYDVSVEDSRERADTALRGLAAELHWNARFRATPPAMKRAGIST